MRAKEAFDGEVLDLRIGELVEVRSEQEILATLDEKGELDGLPFMPEMLRYCGQRFRVYRLAIKLCDTITWTGMHRMQGAVHLEGLRCGGEAHGGCQAGCMIYWKEAWLRRVDDEAGAMAHVPQGKRVCTPETLMAATQQPREPASEGPERFKCQATELLRAAPRSIPWWDVKQYVMDVRSGNAPALGLMRSLAIALFNKFQAFGNRHLPEWMLISKGRRYPCIDGTRKKTPHEVLNLQPGELVQVKTKEEIFATLSPDNKNRGLSFDVEMLKYCGQTARVLRRVERIVDERTGGIVQFSNPCIILEDVVCCGDYHQYCPRSIYPYWREIWLRRAE